MGTLVLILIVMVLSFVGGVYFEKSNSISKVKPIKRVIRNINAERTIVVDRSSK